MADLNPLSLMNAALAGLGADLKSRSDSDYSDEMFKSGANFTDIMMARVSARQGDSSDDAADVQADYADKSRPERVKPLKTPAVDDRYDIAPRDRDMAPRDRDVARSDDKPVVEAKEKPAAKTAVKDVAKSAKAADDSAEWADDRAVKGMQKMATTMLEAEKEGKITLPPTIKKILEEMAASDGSPGQILPLVQNMLVALRKLDQTASAVDLKAPMGEMTWPKAVTDLFKDLQVNPGVKADQPVDLGKLIKALRTLANLVQQNAPKKDGNDMSAAEAAQLLGVLPKAILVDKKAETTSDTADTDKAETEKAVDSLLTGKVTSDVAIDSAAAAAAAAVAPTVTTTEHVAGPSMVRAAGVSADKSDDKTPSRDDLLAGLAKGARQDKPTAMNGGSNSNNGAASDNGKGSGSSAGAQAAVPPLSLQFENHVTTLNPMAAALSARSSFTASVASAPATTANAVAHPATQQIIVSLQKGAITKDTSLSIQLNPAELGRVDVKITIDATGKASAQIIADRADTLLLLQKDSSHLEKALQQAGLNNSAQDLHYSLREQNSQQRGQEFAGHKRRRALFDDESSQKVTMDTPISADGLPHKVNYHA